MTKVQPGTAGEDTAPRRPVTRAPLDDRREDRAVVSGIVGDADRLAAVARTRLLDTPREEAYDRIARLAGHVLDAPVATVSLIAGQRQFYKAAIGLPEPLATERETSLEFSFCKFTIARDAPLVIPDTHADAEVAAMAAVTDYGVRAYAGVPLRLEGQAVGTLCVMDLRPRRWSEEQLAMLRDLAATVETEMRLRLTAEQREGERQAAEAARAGAERATRAMSDFLAMLSHDLRTPLNAIGGYRQLLELGLHGPLTEGQRETLERIKRAQEHAQHLLSEVLSYAKLEAGQVPLSLAHVPVGATLRSLEALIRPQLDAKQLAFAVNGSDDGLWMHVDPDKLSRIVINLLTNAIKFTPADGRVTLSWRSADRALVISVEDTGVGVPAERIEAIFEPFVQVPGQKALNPDGVGLGLAIGRRLARAMGGDLRASSVVGEGTVFELTVPRGQAPDPGHG